MADAVVVGSGPNGLAAAIRLTQAGLQVVVCEANAAVGGGTGSGERTVAGLVHDDCAAFHPLGVASPFFASLGLEQRGLRWLWPPVDVAHPLDDGRAGAAVRGGSADAPLGVDAARWGRLFSPLVRGFDALAPQFLQPVVFGPTPRSPLAPPSAGRFGMLGDAVRLARFGMRAAAPATALARVFRDEPARALFAGVAAHAFRRLDTPLSSAVGLVLGAAAHAVGWPVVRGGTHELTRALVAELESLGGRVLTGTRIDSLGRAREVAGGRPRVVMLDTSARAAVGIAGNAMPARVRWALSRFRYGPAAFKVDMAVEGGVPWRAVECRRAGTVHVGGSARGIAAAEAETVRGRMPRRPFVLVGQQHVADPSRSRGSLHPVYAYAHVPAGFSEDATEAVLAQIERFAPGLRERVVAVRSRGPVQLEAGDANFVGGDIGAGANTGGQIVFRPRVAPDPYRLGPGLFLCSSATPPGGGVHGMCGYHAAESALRSL